MEHLTDETLAVRAAGGDTQAEEMLLQRHTRLVKVCARPYFLVGGDGEDLLQEGMLGLLVACRTFQKATGAAFVTYAQTCIRNRILTAVKAAARRKHTPLNQAVSLETLESKQTSAATGRLRALEEQILAQEGVNALLERFSHALSAFENQVLRLFLDGLRYQEMAERLGKPVKSVDNAVQRIRRKLEAFR